MALYLHGDDDNEENNATNNNNKNHFLINHPAVPPRNAAVEQ